MPIVLTFEAEDMQSLMADVRSFLSASSAEVIPLNTAAAPAVASGPRLVTETAILTAEQIIAGVTLKPTDSSSIAGDARVKKGEYVRFGNEEWLVEQTYRGKLVISNEDGKADLVNATDCHAVTQEPPAGPRAGTAAALLPAETVQTVQTVHSQAAVPVDTTSAGIDPNAKITVEMANKLRDMATKLVSDEKISAAQVFEKLASFRGANNFDKLTMGEAMIAEEWLASVGSKLGF